ncbi:MAG: alpha-amylase family glycosyl hydrolase [Promethearchaeota archaeon]
MVNHTKKKWLNHPKIYEINTWPWLNSLSNQYGYSIDLKNIPEELIKQDLRHFDAIWLMGVWERSPRGRKIALKHPGLRGEYHNALNNFKDEDVVGSPYSVYCYRVDPHLGGKEGLETVRNQLAEQNIKLILDYVPNHTSLDHLWTLEKPNIYIEGTQEDLTSKPYDFFLAGNRIIAHGRDPYFYPWGDTAQINAFSQEARQKTIKTLLNIAKQCDGVRCDMAMLLTNEVFCKTWGARAGPIPEKEFWREIIPAVQEEYSNFLFIAEVYWDMEWELQQQGFDFCYDKRLYDRMVHENPRTIRAHLTAEWNYQRKLLRFIENHDEQRAMSVFGGERTRAAAVLALMLPGAKLIHEGQMKGYTIKLPVQLGRRKNESEDQNLKDFYLQLINAIPGWKFNDAKWMLCKIEPAGNFSNNNLIAHLWWIDNDYILTIINYSPYPSQGNVRIDPLKYGDFEWSFFDTMHDKIYVYRGEDLNKFGLYIDLNGWNYHIFKIKRNYPK